MSQDVISYSEEALDNAWLKISHHIDAYHGYPDIQQDILVTEANRLAEVAQDQHTKSHELQTGSIALVKTVKIG